MQMTTQQTSEKKASDKKGSGNKEGGTVSITPRNVSYADWYQDIVAKAELAEHSAVRGCMVIRPHGYAIWEKMQRELDDRFKATGHVNAYFPLFIPLSFFSKEEQHAAGFAKECAVVTHHRLKAVDGTVQVDPESKLEEPLVIRPTSETIIWNQYRNWIQSYRDLPILINQWANVVRWELRTRLFLRTAEFLWQEGHTAHATEEEALVETEKMLSVYADFAKNVMCVPVVRGRKTEGERFAGALDTMCIEAMMQDGKALQAGTSHYLGQNFAKSSDVKFLNKEGKLEYVYATSWGVSTRLVGALIMTHSDDGGLVLPPKLAPIQVAIVPIYRKDDEKQKVLAEAEKVRQELVAMGVSVKLDDRDNMQPGAKYYEWEMKGVPLRIEIGPKDLEKGVLCLVRRFVMERAGETPEEQRKRQKTFVPRAEAIASIKTLFETMQQELYDRAVAFRQKRSRVIDDLGEFERFFKEEGGGFAWVHFAGSKDDERRFGELCDTSIRCIPFEEELPEGAKGAGRCIFTGQPSTARLLVAKSY
jgi:prolyl-tRNA synthetase